MPKITYLNTPLSSSDIAKLKIGDQVLLSGTIYTARDMAHKYLAEKNYPESLPFNLKNGAIYHCGPIVKKKGNKFKAIAAGPTTSMRNEPYEAEVIAKYGLKAIIGKGGMGDRTLQALKKYKAVYLAATGGAAQVLKESIKDIPNVYMLAEFGAPEAFWEIKVKNFPTIVTMDAQGNSLHKRIEETSKKRLEKLSYKQLAL